jgi:hypothetical protein
VVAYFIQDGMPGYGGKRVGLLVDVFLIAGSSSRIPKGNWDYLVKYKTNLCSEIPLQPSQTQTRQIKHKILRYHYLRVNISQKIKME